MASKQTYECFVCKKNGFADVRVYLDGKDANGKTIYKNPDMTPHAHQLSKTDNSTTGSTQGSQPQASTTIVTEPTSLKIINARLDRIVSLLESYNRMLALLLDPAQREKLKPQDDFQGDRNLLDNR